jgi:hypothetical protein
LTFIIEKDEGTAARRRVPFRVFNSDGTSPDTGFSTVTVLHSINGGAQAVSTNSSSVVSANAGMYYIEFTAAEVATLGSMAVFVDAEAADFEQHVANVQVVNSNPMSTESHGAYLQPTTAARKLDVTAGGTAGIDWANVEAPTTEVDLSGTTIQGADRATDVTNAVALTAASRSLVAEDSADSVWDEARSAHVAAGSFGQYVVSDAGSGLSSNASVLLKPAVHSLATVRGIENDSVMTIAGVTNVSTEIAALNDIDGTAVALTAASRSLVAQDSADSVWDEAASAHVADGSFGRRLAIIDTGQAQGGAASSVSLDAGASATDDFYNNTIIVLTGGTGVGQSRVIDDYTGVSRLASVNGNWITNPDATSDYVVIPFGAIPGATAPTAAANADAVWDEARSGHVAAGSFGEYVVSDAGSGLSSNASILLRPTTHSLATVRGIENVANIPSGGSTPAQIADAVWDEAMSAHTGLGTFGLASQVASAGSVSRGGSTSVITLGSGETTVDDVHIGAFLAVQYPDGTWVGGIVDDYDGSDQSVALRSALPVSASSTTYVLFQGSPAFDASSDTVTIGASNITMNANVVQVSGDAAAADNLEAGFDGTGYDSGITVFVKDSVATITGVTNTATLINALNDIDGSAVTLHAGTHSNVTIQGVSNYLNLPRVTLDGTSSEGSITGLVLTGGSGTTSFYDGQLVIITSGTGAGQARTILDYRGDTNLATVTREFATAPDGTSVFVVTAADIPAILEAGTAQAGAVGSITLDAQASAVNNTYVDAWIMITAGTGIGQTRVIGVYNGTTKVATVVPNWTTTPDGTSVYQVIPAARVDVAAWAGNAVTASGGNPDVNVESIDAIDSALTVFVKDSIATIAGVTNVSTEIAALNDIDGSAVTLNDGGLTAAKFAAGAVDAAALATDAGQEIADQVLDRNMATGADSGTSAIRTPRDALRTLRNRVASDGTQIYVYQEDDTTIKWTASITTVVSTNPHISGADPNS